MCALRPRLSTCEGTDLQPREGTDPSLIPTVVDIIIGKVRAKVSRSHTSNPASLVPCRAHFHCILTDSRCGVFRRISTTVRYYFYILASDQPFSLRSAF